MRFRPPSLESLRIVGWYALLSILWITASDAILRNLTSDPARLTQLQTAKGWLYVTVSGALIYGLLWRAFARADAAFRALRESEERFRLAIEVTCAGLWDLRLDPERPQSEPVSTFLAPTLKAILGYANADFPDSLAAWQERVHPDDRKWVQRATAAHFEGEAPAYDVHYRIQRRDGTWRWVHSVGRVRRDDAGRPVRWTGIDRDVTEQMEASERYRLYLDVAGVMIIATDREGRVTLANRRALETLDQTELDVLGHPWPGSFAEPQVAQAVRAEEELALRKQGPLADRLEYAIRAAGGVERIVAWRRTLLRDAAGRPVGVLRSGEDVTEQRAAQRAVEESETRLRLALRAANQGLYDLDLRTGRAVVNDTYARMLGYPPAELEETITGWRDRLHPDDRQAAYRAYEDYVAGRTDEYRVEFRNRTKDGRWKWILSLGAIVERDAVGRPLRMLGTHTDIDDAKAREVALQRANRALALRAETNRLVTQTDDERELLRAVCRLAVEQGGYRMAWVGLAGPEPERLVEPVAWAGTGTDYLQEIRITWGDDPAGRGPTGTAIRTGASRVARDIEAEPGYELWREAARARGFASSAAVPLLVGAKAIAALNLYAGEPDAFDTDELVLLEDLGRDVAYGLSALRARAQVRHLAARQEEAREAERARVSQELHDELGQGLTGLKLDLSWVRDRLSSADAEGRERVGETLRLLDATIDAVRRIAAELRPGVLDDLGLEAAMQWQAREFTKRSGIPVRLERGSDLPALAPARATALFRIFQEALTNVARHAQARQVTVRYGAESGFVRLEIADDGVGFDIAAPSSGGRRTLGLLGIQERARSHGGAAVVESEPGRGTTVTCAVPVDVS